MKAHQLPVGAIQEEIVIRLHFPSGTPDGIRDAVVAAIRVKIPVMARNELARARIGAMIDASLP